MQIDQFTKSVVSLRINKASGYRPAEWETPLQYFEQDYAVVGKHNGKNVYESFTFLNKNSRNRARIIWSTMFGRPAWIAQGTREVEEFKDPNVDSGGYPELPDPASPTNRRRRGAEIEAVDDPMWNKERFVSFEDVATPSLALKWVYLSGPDAVHDGDGKGGEVLSVLPEQVRIRQIK